MWLREILVLALCRQVEQPMIKRKLITTENDVKAIVKRWFDHWSAWSYAPIQNGMGVHGIPDRVGCVPIVVTQEMVGKKIGLFIAVEAKKPGRRGEENAGATGLQVSQLRGILTADGAAAMVDGEEDMMAFAEHLDAITEGRGNNAAKLKLERRIKNNG
jgi:hypothetical protein